MFRKRSYQWHFWSGDSLIWGHLKRTIVWTMVWVWSGPWSHNSLNNGLEVVIRCLEKGLISGIFGLGIVWSEVIWSAQLSGRWSGFGLGHGRTIVWTMVWFGSDQRSFLSGKVWSEKVLSALRAYTVFWAHISSIRGYSRLARSDQRSLPYGTSTWEPIKSGLDFEFSKMRFYIHTIEQEQKQFFKAVTRKQLFD